MPRISIKFLLLLPLLLSAGGRAFGATPAVIVVRDAGNTASSGTFTVSFDGFTETVLYGQFSTPESVASALAGMFSRDYLRSGLYAGASGPVVSFSRRDGSTPGQVKVTGASTRFVLTPTGFGSGARVMPAPTRPAVMPAVACPGRGCDQELRADSRQEPQPIPLPMPHSVGTSPAGVGYVPVSDTAFIGDTILMNWPDVNLGNSFGVFGVTEGTVAQITQRYWPVSCDSCSQNQYSGFQYLVSNGATRVVFLMGTYDVIGSQPCRGSDQSWDGNAGSKGDPIANYTSEIRSAQQSFPEVSIVVGTIPPLGVPYVGAGCSMVLDALNSRIRAMSADLNVPVVDFNAAMQAADIKSDGSNAGITPRSEGYAAMLGAYNSANR